MSLKCCDTRWGDRGGDQGRVWGRDVEVTRKVTKRDTHSQGKWLPLEYAKGPVSSSLVLDLHITHECWGSNPIPSLNRYLHYPNDVDRSLNETVTDKIRKVMCTGCVGCCRWHPVCRSHATAESCGTTQILILWEKQIKIQTTTNVFLVTWSSDMNWNLETKSCMFRSGCDERISLNLFTTRPFLHNRVF
jgi:hypothetical protein